MSLRRIAKFLDLDEHEDNLSCERLENDLCNENDTTSAAVLVEDGSFSWGSDAPTLNQLVFVLIFVQRTLSELNKSAGDGV